MKKILIVEDDEDIVHALSIRLEAVGYEVVRAFDVVLGTSAAVREKPDLAILDVSMPGGNGIMLAERMRWQATLPSSPFMRRFVTCLA